MCLATPAKVVEIADDGENAVVSLGGVKTPCSLALVEDVAVGDYVILHVGALSKLAPAEAERTLALLAEMAAHGAAVEAAEGAAAEGAAP
ncbi:MAG TPA: HypC/HybG/HupF family hydrogenase formation chaperone [Azospirillaceae bacterium]|nr:HypC/HybG/HupF family hydrogenase formation chaperone [Azospirillaceae bacterium]